MSASVSRQLVAAITQRTGRILQPPPGFSSPEDAIAAWLETTPGAQETAAAYLALPALPPLQDGNPTAIHLRELELRTRIEEAVHGRSPPGEIAGFVLTPRGRGPLRVLAGIALRVGGGRFGPLRRLVSRRTPI